MGINPNTGNNPMWNAARITNLEKQQLEYEANEPISKTKRILSYIVMVLLVLGLIGIILLFIFL
ncbi:MAG: hypothetical protein NC124_19245 [Clostridium sp.]|nr:hypothetical protein [Clostridium sp.]